MATELAELLVADADALRAWLEENHETSDGVRLVLGKKGGTDTTLTWAEAVEEALCFGWIDGQAGKRDEGKKHMLYGLMGMFIMVSAAAIVNVIMNTFPVPSTTNTMGNIFDNR